MKVCFIGAGYVGLTSAAVFAESGHKAYVVDIDKEKISTIKQGESPFYEPGLGGLIAKNIDSKRLTATTDLDKAAADSDIIFAAVGTPVGDKGKADLSQVKTVIKNLAEVLNKKYKLIVIKSTVPVGTTRSLEKLIKKINPQANFDIAFCPEFLRESTAVKDTQNPDRVIIGTDSDRAFKLLKKIHQPLTDNIIRTSPESAEIIKYAANCYLALRIGFIDQIASLAEQTGADVKEIIKGISEDKRIGRHYWYPGIGYGGYCFPKDVAALAKVFDRADLKDNLFTKLDQLNCQRPVYYAGELDKKLNGVKNKKIAVLGLTAKPGTGDMRGAQSISFIKYLTAKGAIVSAYDPKGMEEAKEIMPDINYADSAEQAVNKAEAAAVLCEWPEFDNLNWKRVKELMSGELIFDAKRMFKPEKVKKAGLKYMGVGIGSW